MSTEQTAVQPEAPAPEEAQPPGLVELLKQYEGAPTQEDIDKWKGQYGDVYVSGFSEDDLYIWRPVFRKEWREFQERVQNPEENLNQLDFEELVCQTCILWRASQASFMKAGTATTLHEQILQNSNFLTPQAASMFVARL